MGKYITVDMHSLLNKHDYETSQDKKETVSPVKRW